MTNITFELHIALWAIGFNTFWRLLAQDNKIYDVKWFLVHLITKKCCSQWLSYIKHYILQEISNQIFNHKLWHSFSKMKIKWQFYGRLEWYLKICQQYQRLIVMVDCIEFLDPFAKIEFEISFIFKIKTLVIFTVLEIQFSLVVQNYPA